MTYEDFNKAFPKTTAVLQTRMNNRCSAGYVIVDAPSDCCWLDRDELRTEGFQAVRDMIDHFGIKDPGNELLIEICCALDDLFRKMCNGKKYYLVDSLEAVRDIPLCMATCHTSDPTCSFVVIFTTELNSAMNSKFYDMYMSALLLADLDEREDNLIFEHLPGVTTNIAKYLANDSFMKSFNDFKRRAPELGVVDDNEVDPEMESYIIIDFANSTFNEILEAVRETLDIGYEYISFPDPEYIIDTDEEHDADLKIAAYLYSIAYFNNDIPPHFAIACEDYNLIHIINASYSGGPEETAKLLDSATTLPREDAYVNYDEDDED